MSELLSFMAVVVSIGSLGWTIWYNRRQASVNPMIGYLAQLNSVEEMIAEYPSVLKFHSIALAELDEAGVTAQEFAYLVSSFTLGGAWYQAYGSEEEVPFDGYRGRICAAEATKRA